MRLAAENLATELLTLPEKFLQHELAELHRVSEGSYHLVQKLVNDYQRKVNPPSDEEEEEAAE